MFASLPSSASVLKACIITNTTFARVSSFGGQFLSLLVKPHSVTQHGFVPRPQALKNSLSSSLTRYSVVLSGFRLG